MKLKINYLYWTCQILGWGGYSAIGFAITTFYIGWHPAVVVGFGLFLLYSIALTHLLRVQIKRRGWLLLPAVRGLPRIFGSAIFVGLIETILIVTLAQVLPGENSFDRTAIVSTAGGVTFVTCTWAAMYVGINWNRRYRQAQLREVQLQLTLRQAELRALQAQVNPHFLFNSLNTIRGMVVEDPARAQHMITSLASLLRRALQSSRAQLVPLADEMDAVADYLSLEATRFEERLQVSLEIDPDARKFTVPAMLVQTLVENAVKHGISQLSSGGTVCVRGIQNHDALVLEVKNPGKIRDPDPSGTHTGLDNARERLRLFYGDRATLELSESNGAVTATVLIPGIVRKETG
ncbi:MAG TPA: histidine kinase [Bryobacteraceae bacterium]|jgi:signal transduction histidine kinase